MASGSVSVSPGTLETKVIVAPNSPSARAKASVAPASTPGQHKGKVIVRKVRQRPAPSVRAASSSRRSTDSSDSRIARTASGKAITAAASAAPVQRNSRVTPNQRSSGPPIGPAGAKAISSTQPVTTGGTTNGRWISASSKVPADQQRQPHDRPDALHRQGRVKPKRAKIAWPRALSRKRRKPSAAGLRDAASRATG